MAIKTKVKPRAGGPEDIALGNKIRARRIAAGMSQEGLASKLGVSFQQVQKYEKGVNRVSASRLQVIADALGESISYFNAGKDCPVSKTGQEMRALMSDPVNQRMLRALSLIDDQSLRYQLVRLAEKISGVRDE